MTRHADEPAKTVNVDLCFVPVSAPEQTKADVETSAGASLAENSDGENSDGDISISYPGQVFADSERSYDEAMNAYADQRAEVEAKAAQPEEDPLKAERAALRTDEERLRLERRLLRQQREKEDEAWRAYRRVRRSFNRWWNRLDKVAKAIFRPQKLAVDAEWQRRRA